jgi:tagatose 6-phosphate kinase
MITTVTLNAAIDKLYIVDKMNPGEVMRVKHTSNSAGGKGLNVARIIALLGEQVLATGIIGGYSGYYFEELAKRDSINLDFVKGEEETRTCVNIRDLQSGDNTELLESGNSTDEYILERFYEKFQRLLKDSELVSISGSLPLGVDKGYYQRLIYLAEESGKKVILDTSGEPLKEGLKARPTLIKPNLKELSQYFKKTITSREDILLCAKSLLAEGAGTVAISLGREGVLAVNHEGVFEGIPPRIEAVNTVGCGDAMVAGFAVGFCRNLEMEDMLRVAVSVSAASALSLETGRFLADDYNHLISAVKVRRVS